MTHCCGASNAVFQEEGFRRHHRHHHRPRPGEDFALVDSIPYNGEIVSPCIKKIILVFNRNVTNSSVWGNNLAQIDLWQGTNKVKIHIKKGRSSNVIIIRPVCPLLPGKKYKIRIKSGLLATDGETLDSCILSVFYTDCG
jgi:hypothetical protein